MISPLPFVYLCCQREIATYVSSLPECNHIRLLIDVTAGHVYTTNFCRTCNSERIIIETMHRN
jgi:hypothetical protein